MAAANRGLDQRAYARDEGTSGPPPDPTQPRVIYQTPNYRVVLRALARYPRGYVEIEQRRETALQTESWVYVDSFDLDLKDRRVPAGQSAATTAADVLLVTVLRGLAGL